jgi:hypothetical protein
VFALRNLATGEYWGSGAWTEDPDLISRFESPEEAQTAARSINEDGYAEIVEVELEIIAMDWLGLVETHEHAEVTQ